MIAERVRKNNEVYYDLHRVVRSGNSTCTAEQILDGGSVLLTQLSMLIILELPALTAGQAGSEKNNMHRYTNFIKIHASNFKLGLFMHIVYRTQ